MLFINYVQFCVFLHYLKSKMSVSEHVRSVINSCTQTISLTRDSHTSKKPTHLPCRIYCKTYICLQLLVGFHQCI